MTNVMFFLFVTPIVALLGGIIGAASFYKFKQTKYNNILKILCAFIWFSSIMCLMLWSEIQIVLARMGKASPYSEMGTVVITNAASPNKSIR